MKITLFSPAKLNLFLHILKRRKDGYHDLQTAFQLIDLKDTLTFELRKDAQIHLHTDLTFPAKENLIWQAAKSLQQHAQVSLGVNIQLEKKIPMGAGLGGGSSNAATTLIALNHLWKTHLSLETLAKLGQALGADVPLFVKGKSSWAEGIGELLTPMSWPESWYLLLIPACHVKTAEVFSHPNLIRNSPRINATDFLSHPEKTRNDFEPLVRRLYPLIDQTFLWLDSFHLSVKPRLTGSGCAIFVKIQHPDEAIPFLAQKPANLEIILAKSSNSSCPLNNLKWLF